MPIMHNKDTVPILQLCYVYALQYAPACHQQIRSIAIHGQDQEIISLDS